MNITIFNEYHPTAKTGKEVKTYPEGIHGALKKIFKDDVNITVTTVTQEEPENGLTDKVLDNTDVLIWWGNKWQENILDGVADKVAKRILAGMGGIFLHASAASKPFKRLMGTTCSHKYRETDERQRLWTVNPSHPIAYGIPETFSLDNEETYGEFFDIPTPDELVFLSWSPGGEVFRSGVTFRRGYGKIFYFSPGHETFPTFNNENIKKIIYNAALWAAPNRRAEIPQTIQQTQAVETVKKGFFRRK